MAINQVHARNLFTRAVSDIYEEKLMPKLLFMSMAQETTTRSRFVSTEVRRYNETIATDVIRGSRGNRNKFDRLTQKIYQPPLYDEYFDLTTLDIYDQLFGRPQVEGNTILDLAEEAATKMAYLRGKIDRAIELQWSQVYDTGIVQLTNGDNIDFKRKAASLVVLSGDRRWNQSGATILQDLNDAGTFIRTEGKSDVGEFKLILGEAALNSLITNSEIQNLGDQRYLHRLDIMPVEMRMDGAVYHGTLSANSYKFHLYTYPEYYDSGTNPQSQTHNRYWPTNKVLVMPYSGSVLRTKFAGIPALYRGNDSMPEYYRYVDEKYLMNNYIDQLNRSHNFEILSAPLAVPESIDQIYTIQVQDV